MAQHSRLVGLDLLRFFAAVAVMVFHLAFWSWVPEHSTPKAILNGATAYPELVPYSWWGWVGVEIFFVISGFVIAYSASKVDAFRFARSRFLRLFPAALICASLTLAVALIIQAAPASVLLQRYIKTVAFWPIGGWIDGVYWTLGIEIVFYSIVLVLLGIRRFTLIETVMAILGIGSTLVWTLHFAVSNGASEPTAFGIGFRWWQLLLVHHGMYFCAGVFMWAGAVRGWTPFRVSILAITLAGGILPILAEANEKAASFGLGQVQLVPVAVWLASIATIWASTYFDDAWSCNWPQPLLDAVKTLGLATYPLYLLHDVVGAAILRWLLMCGAHRLLALGASMALVTATAVVVTITVERWLRHWLGSIIRDSYPQTAT